MGRLCNVVYAALIEEAGPLADRSEVRSHVDGVLRRAEAETRRGKGSVTAAQAQRVIAQMRDYDSRIVDGRLREAE